VVWWLGVAGSTIDHLIAMTIFLGALLIFISLFNQTIQTAILYQHNRAIATKCSDLLDNILLNPGYPLDWGKNDSATVTIFGLQDPEFTQYRLSSFSLMRLQSSMGRPIYYSETNQYYSNVTMGFGSFLLVSSAKALNYSTAARLLGINNTYGFQLALTPLINVSISESHGGNPLTLNVTVTGNGIPFANATLSYLLIEVKNGSDFPSYSITPFNNLHTDNEGSRVLEFQNVGASESYALIVYARLGGLVGVGYRQRIMADSHVIPLVENISERQVIVTHSRDICNIGASPVSFNATFIILSQDFSLRPVPIEDPAWEVHQGEYVNLTIPTFEPGILAVAYQSENKTGVVLMPWGVSSMGFPVVFGDNPSNKTWVATDIRQVLVGNVAYQAKLALWSLEGYGVMG
jgi:hypothetical protein